MRLTCWFFSRFSSAVVNSLVSGGRFPRREEEDTRFRRTSVWRRVRGATQRRQSARKRANSLSEVPSRGAGKRADSTVDRVSAERGVFGAGGIRIFPVPREDEAAAVLLGMECIGSRPSRDSISVVLARTCKPELSCDLKAQVSTMLVIGGSTESLHPGELAFIPWPTTRKDRPGFPIFGILHSQTIRVEYARYANDTAAMASFRVSR